MNYFNLDFKVFSDMLDGVGLSEGSESRSRLRDVK